MQISKIESLRRNLNDSKEIIEIITGYNAPQEKYNHLRTTSVTIGSVSSISSIHSCWAFVLFKLIRGLRPKRCIELGTCVGISAAYQGSALKLNKSGNLTSFELSPSKIDVARKLFKNLNLHNIETVSGKFQDTLAKELINKSPIDFVFIDGHHDQKATLNYFEILAPSLANNALVVFDDINWSADMKKAWDILKKDQRFSLKIDLFRLGICIFNK